MPNQSAQIVPSEPDKRPGGQPATRRTQDGPARQSMIVPAFGWDAHAQALSDRQVMFAPLVVHWRYRVSDRRQFADWLALREIIFSAQRLAPDPVLADVRYGGTYFAETADGADYGEAADCLTVWGYASTGAMMAMHELCSGRRREKSIVQKDLFDFVMGMREFVDEAGAGHFRQEVVVAAAAWKVQPGEERSHAAPAS